MNEHPSCPICRRSLVVLLLALLGAFPSSPAHAEQPETAIRIRNRVQHQLSPNLIGFNLEDLNSQTYGGVYSQLLYGQDFEEQVDVDDLMPVHPALRKYLYLRRQRDGSVKLVTYGVERGDRRETFEGLKDGPRVDLNSQCVPLEQFSPEVQGAIHQRITGDRQVSYYWRPIVGGAAQARFTLSTDRPFNGLQDQGIEFLTGAGEVGVANLGLFRRGIKLEADRPYEGLLRIRCDKPQELHVSLRGPDGAVLADKTLSVGRSEDDLTRGFEKIEFTLTPTASVLGSFAVTLKSPGTVTLGYVFLQPGPWGRYEGLPLKTELVEAIRGMHPRVIRYNGGMVSDPIVKESYRWKNMIGPRDLRMPFNGTFNPFASHGFGIFEFLDLARAIDVMGVVGVRSDESPEDYLNLLEYANGPAGSVWGALRGRHGHPQPYGLKYIEFGNEENPTPDHAEKFKAVAKAVWAKHPEVVFIMGDGWASEGNDEKLDRLFRPNEPIGRKVPVAADLLRFAQAQGKADQFWWDLHYFAPARIEELYQPLAPYDGLLGAVRFRNEVLKLAPDCKFHLALLEENGAHTGMFRALCHARNHHAIARTGGAGVIAATVANCLQADRLDRVWGQGKIFHNESRVWPQPPYYVDQMISRHWASQVLDCDYSSRRHINALAKMTADGSALVLTVANLEGAPVEVTLHMDGLGFSGKRTVTVETLAADQLHAGNTAENPLAVAPRIEQTSLTFRDSSVAWTFPKYSFTLMRFALATPKNG